MTTMRTARQHDAVPTGAAGGPRSRRAVGRAPHLRPFRTPVRGHAFAAPPPGVTGPGVGQPARLVREPANPADPLAVAVWLDGQPQPPWRIGYLDRGVAARLAPRLDAGLDVTARLDGWVAEPDGRWRRPVVLLLPEPTDAGQVDEEGALRGQRGEGGAPGCSRDGGPGARPRTGSRVWGRPPGVARRVVG